jgi:hydrogenase 3 maturation protease
MPAVKERSTDWSRAVSEKLEGAERLFVIGVGNPGRGDDAAGSLCARRLKHELSRRKPAAPAGSPVFGRCGGKPVRSRPIAVQVLDAGEAPENATGLIREFHPTHVLIVDAALGGFKAGTIFIIDKKKISQEDISTHRIPLIHLIRYLEEGVGCRVILVGIEPQQITVGKPASLAVRSSAARLADWLSGF